MVGEIIYNVSDDGNEKNKQPGDLMSQNSVSNMCPFQEKFCLVLHISGT